MTRLHNLLLILSAIAPFVLAGLAWVQLFTVMQLHSDGMEWQFNATVGIFLIQAAIFAKMVQP